VIEKWSTELMVYVLEAVRVIVISFETVTIAVVILLSYKFPQLLQAIGFRLLEDEDVWKVLLIIPPGMLAWSLREGKETLFPDVSKDNGPLALWPMFWKLKLRVTIAMLWLLLASIICLGLLFFGQAVGINAAGALFLIAIIIALFSAGSLWTASIGVREIIESHGTTHKKP
jgi:hypothetical protein